MYAWNQLLSLAACVQDARIERVDAAEELAPMVDGLTRGLAPSMLIYLDAIEHGPRSVQLRAAYQVGLAHVALVTRARACLATRGRLVRDPDAGARVAALRAGLEPLLRRAGRTAWISFAVIVRAAADDPALVADPVAAAVVRQARAQLASMTAPPWVLEAP
jgi:hypothetical protein